MGENVKLSFDWIKKPIGIIFLIAWIFSIVVLALFYSRGSQYYNFLNVTVASTFFILLFLVIAFFLGETKSDKFSITAMIFLLLHGILNVCAGALLLTHHAYGLTIATGVFCILIFILLFVNAFFIFQKRQ